MTSFDRCIVFFLLPAGSGPCNAFYPDSLLLAAPNSTSLGSLTRSMRSLCVFGRCATVEIFALLLAHTAGIFIFYVTPRLHRDSAFENVQLNQTAGFH
ncbi:MAG TPA: hypothetical protein VF534_28320 [Paraburkholderia sp.]